MKRNFLLIILIFQIQAQDIASIFFGSDILLNKSEKTYNVNSNGLSFGFLLPINVNFADLHYKVRLGLHDASPAEGFDKDIDVYLSATNEFLVGKTFHFDESKFEILPQLGLGMTLESVYATFGEGSVFDIVFYDLSLLLNYPLNGYKMGLMLNYERWLFASHDNFVAKDRLNINLVLTF